MMMNLIKRTVLLVCLSVISHSALAIYFSSFIYEMMSDEDFIAKPIRNDTKNLSMYQISSFKIDKPGPSGEKKIYVKDRELIHTPLELKIEPNSSNFFKILYIGPKDNQERYYRVVFLETPLTAFKNSKEDGTIFFPTVSMSTILIVRPRKQILKYEVDEAKGIIKNTGNTFFRVIIHQGCEGTDEDATHFYMLPGETYQDESVKNTNRKFIIANKRYYQAGKMCF